MKRAIYFLVLGISSLLLSSADIRDRYVILGWNDLGMHCANKDFNNICILPPYNNLYAQIIRVGNADRKPEKISSGITVTYEIPGNTFSMGKTNFWFFEDKSFGVNLQDNIGLTGKGLSGNMDAKTGYYTAEGIPITPYTDNNLTTEDPYQQALLKVFIENQLMCSTKPVIPVSNEIGCVSSGCHSSEDHIINEHDEEGGFDRNNRPIFCASCHASNALGTTGKPELGSLSYVLHKKHSTRTNDCYKCHPGPQTQCHRDVMYMNGKRCQDCHGSVADVASSIKNGRRPWLDEPKCGNCHDANHSENNGKLFRQSTGHSGLYCSACHGSPHAIVPSTNARDNEQNITHQGFAGTLRKCITCHGVNPKSPGPHGLEAPGQDDKPPTLTGKQDCNGNIVINAKDVPEDDMVRTNIAAVRLDNSYSSNYSIDYPQFKEGELTELEIRVNLISPNVNGQAKVMVYDLQGNVSSLIFEYLKNKFSLTPAEINGGIVKAGETLKRSVSLENNSSIFAHSIKSIKLRNNSPEIKLETNGITLPKTFIQNEALTINMTFNSLVAKEVNDFIDIVDSCGNIYSTKIGFTSVKPVITVSDIDFGEVKTGNLMISNFTISNPSMVELKITGYTGPTNKTVFITDFNISESNPLKIPPNSVKEMQVQFKPVEGIVYQDLITFISDADEPDNKVILNGKGSTETIPKAVINTSDVDFGDIEIGSTIKRTFKIENSGTAELSITAVQLPNEQVFIPHMQEISIINPLKIPAGGLFQADIDFKPDEVKNYSDSIVFYSNASGLDSVMYLTGKGIDTTTFVSDNSYPKALFSFIDKSSNEGKVYIKINNIQATIREISLIQSNGIIISSESFPDGTKEEIYSMDVNSLANGLYLFNIKTNDNFYTIKFLKVK